MKEFIGVFDSGMGGITVLKDIIEILPEENILYYGDSLRAPYGKKSKKEILSYSIEITDYLIKKGAKAIVIACNTATSAAVKELRQMYDIPIIGMEPALNLAYKNGEKNILSLATKYTIENDKYIHLQSRFSDVKVTNVIANELVELAENGYSEREIKKYFDKLIIGRDYDSIVLGCTHFIYFREFLRKNYNLNVYDGNQGTIKHLKNLIKQKKGTGKIVIENSKSLEMKEKSEWLLKKIMKE